MNFHCMHQEKKKFFGQHGTNYTTKHTQPIGTTVIHCSPLYATQLVCHLVGRENEDPVKIQD